MTKTKEWIAPKLDAMDAFYEHAEAAREAKEAIAAKAADAEKTEKTEKTEKRDGGDGATEEAGRGWRTLGEATASGADEDEKDTVAQAEKATAKVTPTGTPGTTRLPRRTRPPTFPPRLSRRFAPPSPNCLRRRTLVFSNARSGTNLGTCSNASRRRRCFVARTRTPPARRAKRVRSNSASPPTSYSP